MNDLLKQRILRRLEALSDERGFQIIDYIEFLESKYAERKAPTNFFAKVADTVGDTMRAGTSAAGGGPEPCRASGDGIGSSDGG
jgi:hypothetical protein